MANESIERFISRWQAARGSERANYQLFVGELTELLGLPRPDHVARRVAANSRNWWRNSDGDIKPPGICRTF